jgi:hypothetical protein
MHWPGKKKGGANCIDFAGFDGLKLTVQGT